MLKTTLIFGAGVSAGYGYPTGSSLLKKILVSLEGRSGNNQLYKDIYFGGYHSIDSVINDFTDYSLMLKRQVSEIIFKSEFSVKLFDWDDNFYRFFFQKISPESYQNYKIITFNYDRSFEHYFECFLRTKFKNDKELQKKYRKDLEIIHVHGRLPALSQLDLDSVIEFKEQAVMKPLPYGALNPDNKGYVLSEDNSGTMHFSNGMIVESALEFGTKNFKTIYENQGVLDRAHKILDNSDRILLLGFGYDPLNLSKLGFNWLQGYSKKDIFGTYFTEPESRIYMADLKIKYPAIQELYCSKVLDFFKRNVSLIEPTSHALRIKVSNTQSNS